MAIFLVPDHATEVSHQFGRPSAVSARRVPTMRIEDVGIVPSVFTLSLQRCLNNMHLLYLPLCNVGAIAFDERTNVDLLHSWSLLRLLFVFLLACPFLIIPVLLGLFKKQPGTEDRTEAPAEGGTRIEVSGRGTWNAQADGCSPSSKPDGALAPIERRAA